MNPNISVLPGVTPEHELLRMQVKKFVEREVLPHGESWEKNGEIPRSIIQRMGALGMLGMRFPECYGGADADTTSSVIFAEELGRSTFGGFAITILTQTDTASPSIALAGSEIQKNKYLPAIASGDCLVAIAMTEPNVGSDIAALRTRATRDGGEWVIDGAKTFITNGVNADLYVVAARTDQSAKPSRGVSLFLVEKNTPGFKVERRLEKMGWRSSDTAQLSFENCRLPGDALLGQENHGFAALMKNVQNERLVLAAQALGEAQAAIDLTVEYVKLRGAFGGRLWDKQAIRQRISMLAARVESARYFVYGIAHLDSQNVECIKQVSMIKALCGELVNDVLYDCVQFHGGSGYMLGTAIERMFRDVRVHSIGGGATEIMLEEVAKRI